MKGLKFSIQEALTSQRQNHSVFICCKYLVPGTCTYTCSSSNIRFTHKRMADVFLIDGFDASHLARTQGKLRQGWKDDILVCIHTLGHLRSQKSLQVAACKQKQSDLLSSQLERGIPCTRCGVLVYKHTSSTLNNKGVQCTFALVVTLQTLSPLSPFNL